MPDQRIAEPSQRQQLAAIFKAAVAAVDAYHAVLKAVRIEHRQLLVADAHYRLDAYDRIIVVGAGKATARMALAIESLLDRHIAAGLIVVKHGHTAPLSSIEQVEAAHPVPDEAGVAGTQRILQMARDADEKSLVICLLSGGASALLASPADGISLLDKQDTTRLLLDAGASISELNSVRKHISSVKGGRLAQTAHPAHMLTLIISDVIDDPLDVIASGPTAPDHSTFGEAWAVVAQYGLREKLPSRVVEYLRRGCEARVPETVREDDPCLSGTRNVVIAGIQQALAAAVETASRSGYAARVVSARLQGEAREAARLLAQAAREELAAMQPGERRCLLCGGETTVAVHGSGKGGRNQEFALAFALEIEGAQGVSLLSAGTDGSDGLTDAAGAMVDGTTAKQSRQAGIDPWSHLQQNDSCTFFARLDAALGMRSHFKTGPTGTNVMDIQIVLLDK